MKRLLFVLAVLCIVSCEKPPVEKGYDGYPAICECDCCKTEPIILTSRDQCGCTCEECHCHHFIPEEVLHMYDSNFDIRMFIIASSKEIYGAPEDFELSSKGYLAKDVYNNCFDRNWGICVLENPDAFNWEEGYEYVIYTETAYEWEGDIGKFPYMYWFKTISKIKKESYNLPYYHELW